MEREGCKERLRLEAELVFGDAVDEVDLVVEREGPPDQTKSTSRSNRARIIDQHPFRRRKRGGRGEADAYLRDGRCLSLEALETGSLRSDFTSVASDFCPRAAAISSYPSSPSADGGASCSRGIESFAPDTSEIFPIANGSIDG